MGLRNAIPGLKAHDTVIPVVTAAFNHVEGRKIISAAIADVAGTFVCDAWQWLVDNRPDVISELKRSGNDMDLAYQLEDMVQVSHSADRFVRAHKRAWQLFEERPPIIERQETLFEWTA